MPSVRTALALAAGLVTASAACSVAGGPALAWAADARASGSFEPAVLEVARTRYGRILTDGSGLALYAFDRERHSRPRCYGRCAEAWPPLESSGTPRAGAGVRQRLIGTTRRRGGARQVTYRGHPLYTYVEDSPGVILCHDVFEFRGLWQVIRRSGRPAP